MKWLYCDECYNALEQYCKRNVLSVDFELTAPIVRYAWKKAGLT